MTLQGGKGKQTKKSDLSLSPKDHQTKLNQIKINLCHGYIRPFYKPLSRLFNHTLSLITSSCAGITSTTYSLFSISRWLIWPCLRYIPFTHFLFSALSLFLASPNKRVTPNRIKISPFLFLCLVFGFTFYLGS